MARGVCIAGRGRRHAARGGGTCDRVVVRRALGDVLPDATRPTSETAYLDKEGVRNGGGEEGSKIDTRQVEVVVRYTGCSG